MSPPLSSSFALATFLTLFVTLLASLSAVPVVHGQSAGLGLVQCAPAQVQVGGGSGPYTVSGASPRRRLFVSRSPFLCSHRIRTGPIWSTSGPPDQVTAVLVRVGTVLPAGADGQLAADAEPLETFPALNQSGVASWLVNVPSGEFSDLSIAFYHKSRTDHEWLGNTGGRNDGPPRREGRDGRRQLLGPIHRSIRHLQRLVRLSRSLW